LIIETGWTLDVIGELNLCQISMILDGIQFVKEITNPKKSDLVNKESTNKGKTNLIDELIKQPGIKMRIKKVKRPKRKSKEVI
jgi:hypothetical protein